MQQIIINQKFKDFEEVLKIIYKLEKRGYSVVSLEYVHTHLIIANKEPKELQKIFDAVKNKLEKDNENENN